jgi:hypothetical protein
VEAYIHAGRLKSHCSEHSANLHEPSVEIAETEDQMMEDKECQNKEGKNSEIPKLAAATKSGFEFSTAAC